MSSTSSLFFFYHIYKEIVSMNKLLTLIMFLKWMSGIRQTLQPMSYFLTLDDFSERINPLTYTAPPMAIETPTKIDFCPYIAASICLEPKCWAYRNTQTEQFLPLELINWIIPKNSIPSGHLSYFFLPCCCVMDYLWSNTVATCPFLPLLLN